MSPSKDHKPLILGLGNAHRGDDAVGPVVIKALRQLSPALGEFIIEPSDPLRLVDVWAGRSLIVIDAVKTNDPIPGRIHIFDSPDAIFDNNEIQFSTHSLGLKEAFRLAEAMDKLPASSYIIGIEGENWSMGMPLSEAVSAQVPEILALIRKRVGLLKSA